MVQRNAGIAILIMVLVAVLGTVDAVIVRMLAQDVHPFFMGFTRSIFGLLILLPWIIRQPKILKTDRYWLHILRAALKLVALISLFAALANAGLATVTTISFAAPFFVMLGAWLFLSEKLRTARILAVIFGFGGVVIVLNPTTGSVNLALGFALLSAVATATIQLILKYMGRSEAADTLVAWNLIVTVPLALIPAIWFWANPTAYQWVLLAIQGVNGAAAQLLVTKAFQLADASLIAPVDFARLPLVGVIGFLFFSEMPSYATWIGAALIFVALMLTTYSGRPPAPIR
jgi:drug/metabolite transporter (DMT)-like permease